MTWNDQIAGHVEKKHLLLSTLKASNQWHIMADRNFGYKRLKCARMNTMKDAHNANTYRNVLPDKVVLAAGA
jgi:hypothetical protein